MIQKYRAFDTLNKRMFMVSKIEWDLDDSTYLNVYDPYTGHDFDIDQVILMQSTGLFDKNGVEIYRLDEFEMPGVFGASYIDYCNKCHSFELFTHFKLKECFNCLGDCNWNEVVEEAKNEKIRGCVLELYPELLEQEHDT